MADVQGGQAQTVPFQQTLLVAALMSFSIAQAIASIYGEVVDTLERRPAIAAVVVPGRTP